MKLVQIAPAARLGRAAAPSLEGEGSGLGVMHWGIGRFSGGLPSVTLLGFSRCEPDPSQ